jgi:hypothetical protein
VSSKLDGITYLISPLLQESRIALFARLRADVLKALHVGVAGGEGQVLTGGATYVARQRRVHDPMALIG